MNKDIIRTDQTFATEMGALDLSNKNEVALERLLHALNNRLNLQTEKRLGQAIEALERYLRAVRRRNGIRRNWHPKASQTCDAQTLQLITKGAMTESVGRRLRESLVVEIDGKRYIPEELIPLIQDAILEDTSGKNRGEGKQSLTKILKAILIEKPDVTPDEARDIMDRNREQYGILAMDEDYIELQSSHGKKEAPRNSPPLKTSSIAVILSRLRSASVKTRQK